MVLERAGVPQSLQLFADDFALAMGSLRGSLPVVSGAFATIHQVTGMSLNYRKCHWIQHGNMTSQQLVEWVGTYVPVVCHMQINDSAEYLGVMIGPGGARWTPDTSSFSCIFELSLPIPLS